MKKTPQDVRILLVEDDPLIIQIYKTRFSQEGFQVDVADTGEKAVEMARENPYDLIVLDIVLPYLTGFEVLERLRSFEETKNTKVIMFTNLNSQEDIERARELGVEEFMVKAYFTPTEVVEKIKKILGLQQ